MHFHFSRKAYVKNDFCLAGRRRELRLFMEATGNKLWSFKKTVPSIYRFQISSLTICLCTKIENSRHKQCYLRTNHFARGHKRKLVMKTVRSKNQNVNMNLIPQSPCRYWSWPWAETFGLFLTYKATTLPLSPQASSLYGFNVDKPSIYGLQDEMACTTNV